MRSQLVISAVTTALIAVAVPLVVAGQTTGLTAKEAQNGASSRTAWGDPDLQGVWTNVNEAATPFERPDEYAHVDLEDDQLAAVVQEQQKQAADPETRAARIAGYQRGANFPIHWAEHLDAAENHQRPWLVIDPPDGKIPALTPEGQQRAARGRAARGAPTPPAGPEALGLWSQCITRGVPAIMMPTWYNNTYQILQAPGYVAIVYEMMHDARIIPLDGRPHVEHPVRQLLGDARGRWEGNTLVVETTNFTDKTSFRGSTEQLKVIERFTRVDAETIDWQVTLEEATTWVRPWTFEIPLTNADGQRQVYEYACHEGNQSMENILKGARLQDRISEAAANEK